jgi:hypothetical protein
MDSLTLMLGAATLGADFPPGVEDTPANRELFAKIKAEVDAAPDDQVVAVPWEYADGDREPPPFPGEAT